MPFLQRIRILICCKGFWLILLGFLLSVVASCQSTKRSVWKDEPRLDAGWTKANSPWREASYPPVSGTVPDIPGAEMVDFDDICATCHKTHHETFAGNVHRQQKCESCHGPASRHVETRGKEPGLIRNFKTMTPVQRSEVCATCHEQDACRPGAKWRSSTHANKGVACTDCHQAHYNLPEGTPTTTLEDEQARRNIPRQDIVVRGQDPEKKLPSLRGTSNNLGAIAPGVCYQCHQEKHDLERVAHPHQIGGPNGLNCTTCHDAHGNLSQWSRKNLCLECHDGSPTAAWHSSTHDHVGVACTDCHNPHPKSAVRRLLNIDHTSVRRPERLPMSVQEPQACYKCHSKIQGLTGMASHHPIKEGKVTCSDCHDPHGQAEGNLKEASVNLVCYKCHADKQGPYVYEHPPVTENCTICHEPHGTVANNLLRQPPVFLCLRCHTGHRTPPADHFGIGTSDIDGNPALRPAFYTNCTNCHSAIHGSDLPSQHRAGALLR